MSKVATTTVWVNEKHFKSERLANTYACQGHIFLNLDKNGTYKCRNIDIRYYDRLGLATPCGCKFNTSASAPYFFLYLLVSMSCYTRTLLITPKVQSRLQCCILSWKPGIFHITKFDEPISNIHLEKTICSKSLENP